MPRFDPRRRGLHLVTAPEHARDRVPSYWPAERLARRARLVRHPSRTVPTEHDAVGPAVCMSYDGPSLAERARRLLAAHAACGRDVGQRELIEEIMAHFRAWCAANTLGDPFETA